MKFLGTLVLLISSFAMAASRTEVVGDFTWLGDAAHLEFRGRKKWDYDLSRTEDGSLPKVVLSLPPLSEQMIHKIKGWKAPLIKTVAINNNGVNKSTEITFILSDSKIQSFDYLTDEPSRLIVDFYRDEEAPKSTPVTVASVKTDENKKQKPKKQTKLVTKLPPKLTNRKPSGEFIKMPDDSARDISTFAAASPENNDVNRHGIFDGGDPSFSRFTMKDYEIREEAKILSRTNIYIKFPGLKLGFPHLKNLQKYPPIYEIQNQKNRDTKAASFVLEQYKANKPGIFMKALELYRKEFPKSPYDEIMGYLEADVYYQMWEKLRSPATFAKAMTLYRQLVENYPKSPLVERTLLLMGYSYQDTKDYFKALTSLQRFLRTQPKSEHYDDVRLTVADAYLQINKYKDALRTFREIIEKPRKEEAAIAATYLTGDVFFKQNKYKEAIDSYAAALKKYPGAWKDYPNAYYNTAESLFWLGEYKQSLDNYRNFLQRYPSHSHCGFAMTRLGEILEILGADQQRVMGAFLEGQFRYRSSEGAKVASVRIISHRMNSMKPKELESSIEELREIEKASTLDGIGEFITIAIGDGYFTREEYDKSVGVLVEFYQKNPESLNLPVFRQRIVRSITEKIRSKINDKKSIGALEEYVKYSDNWLKGSGRVDVRYYVGVALEKAGLYKEAEAIIRETLNKIQANKGTEREAVTNVFEELPTEDALNLRLAALSIKTGETNKAYKFLKGIQSPDKLTFEEQVERAELIADVSEKRGNVNMARAHLQSLVDTWKGQPEQVSSPYLKMAKIDRKAKNYESARINLKKIIDLANDSKNVPESIHMESLRLQGDTLVKLGETRQAVKVFEDLLEKFEDKMPLDSIRYRAGKLLFDIGDLKAGKKLWDPLIVKQDEKENGNNVWGRLASEQLREVDFNKDYRKYIKRIPAMERK